MALKGHSRSEAPENYRRLLETLERFLIREEPSRYERLRQKIDAWLAKMAEKDVPAGLLELLQEEEVTRALTEGELEWLLRISPSDRPRDKEFYRRALELYRE